MSFDGLRVGLRGLFWGLVYLGTACAALIVFAPAGLFAWAVWVAVFAIICHDAHTRFVTERIDA